jgi:hypothetical protein
MVENEEKSDSCEPILTFTESNETVYTIFRSGISKSASKYRYMTGG